MSRRRHTRRSSHRRKHSAKHGLVSEVDPTSDLAASSDEFAATACATGIDREEVEGHDFDAEPAGLIPAQSTLEPAGVSMGEASTVAADPAERPDDGAREVCQAHPQIEADVVQGGPKGSECSRRRPRAEKEGLIGCGRRAAPNERRRKPAKRWIALLAAFLGIIAAAGLWLRPWGATDAGPGAPTAAVSPLPERSSAEPTIAAGAVAPPDDAAALDDLLANFHAAATPEEKAAFVCGGTDLLPAMRDYYATHPSESRLRRRIDGAVPVPGFGGALVSGRLLYDDAVVHRWIAEKSAAGWRLDWRALTGWSGMPWDDFLSRRPTQPPVLRVNARYDDCWIGGFRDSARYVCLRLTAPGSSEAAWAYAERSSPEAEAIRKAANLFGKNLDPWEPAVMVAERQLRATERPEPDASPNSRAQTEIPPYPRSPGTVQRSDEFRLTLRLAFPEDAGGSLLPQLRVIAVEGVDWLDPAAHPSQPRPALSQN